MQRSLIFIIIAFLITGMLSAEVRLESEEIYETVSLLEEPLDPDIFLIVGLSASGIEDGKIEEYRQAYAAIGEDMKQQLSSEMDSYQQAEKVLDYLHENLFTEYSLRQTKMDVLLDTGVFNCVSSAIAYMYFIKLLDIPVYGVYAGDHAFCTIDFGDKIVDVETTNPYGFDPGTKKEFHDSFTGNTGYSYVPPQDYHLRTIIGEKEILGFILQNRIASNQHQRQYERSVGLALDRYTLTGSSMGKRDFYTAIRNVIVEFNEEGQFMKGIDFLFSVPEKYGILEEPAMLQLLGNLGFNHLVSLVNQEDLISAGRFLTDTEEWGDLYGIDRSEWIMITERKRVELIVRDEPYEIALMEVQQSFDERKIPIEQWKRSLIYLYSKKADEISHQNGPLAACNYLENLDEMHQRWGEISRLLNIYRHNYAVEIHNQFAMYFNQGDYAVAAQLVKQGLEEIPDSPMLLKDKNYLIQVGAWNPES